MFGGLRAGTAHDLVEMLRRHYLPEGRPAGGIFAAEIESPDGRRRADALWCPWSIAGGEGLIGHEVKVSRSDILTELADPMKADPWARYCRQWWLVVADPALIDGLTIPAAWGVMAPPSGRKRRSMTVVRPAPLLKANDTGAAWRRVASWADHRTAERIRDADWKRSSAESRAERAEAELLERRMAEPGRVDHRAAKVGRILAELDKLYWRAAIDDNDVDGIVAAIRDLDEHRRLARYMRDAIQSMANDARRFAEPVERVVRDLDRLAKESEARVAVTVAVKPPSSAAVGEHKPSVETAA